jgi:hypothetical protein
MVTNITIERRETEHNFLCFCSLICLLSGKKLNLPNIFLLLLKNPTYKQILKKLVSIDTDYELFKLFIDFDPSLSKSKYILKFLNSREGKVIIANNVKQF